MGGLFENGEGADCKNRPLWTTHRQKIVDLGLQENLQLVHLRFLIYDQVQDLVILPNHKSLISKGHDV